MIRFTVDNGVWKISHLNPDRNDEDKFFDQVDIYQVCTQQSLALWSMGVENQHHRIRTREKVSLALRKCIARKPKPPMKPIELNTPPEQTQTITRAIFDIVKEHGPLTISETWDHVKKVGLRGLTSKRHMKIVLRWMRERQKLRLICNHVGAQKHFLYTTWFTKHNFKQKPKPASDSPQPKSP
ncbi:hypothetical protein FF1_027040 [Malus domestica]